MNDTDTQVESAQDVSLDLDIAKQFLVDYSSNKTLVDWAVKQDDPREALVSRIDGVCQVIGQAREFTKTGKGLTLPKSMEFGSDSLADICAAIVNDRSNNASLKGKAGKAGRAILKALKG